MYKRFPAWLYCSQHQIRNHEVWCRGGFEAEVFVWERADPTGNLLVGEIAVENADYATKSFTFDVSIDKNGKTLTVKIDGESKTVVEGVEFVLGEVESIVTSSTTNSAKSEDAVSLPKQS